MSIITDGAQRWTQKTLAYVLELARFVRAPRLLLRQPGDDRQRAAGTQPADQVGEEARLVEDVLGTLDAPDHIERAGGENCLLDVLAVETRLTADALQPGRGARPAPLYRA